ncbi:MAG TPA: transferase [Candidatus Omnitrophota bacterium]|nr:transferase [Candidatus Omnitrophota bacterium]
MNLSMPFSELKPYIAKQLDHFFPDSYRFDGADVDSALDAAIQRAEYCFKHVDMRYYNDERGACFYHLHSDQYTSFLYFLSNSLWLKSQNKPLCDKLLFLNKTLNSMFISYHCKLPDIFVFSHAIGSVIGNAVYSDFLVVFQNVTINTGDDTGVWQPPKLGKGVFLGADVKIIGSGTIGHFSSIGVGSCIYKFDVPDHSVVFTDTNGKLNIKKHEKPCRAQAYFNVDIQKH